MKKKIFNLFGTGLLLMSIAATGNMKTVEAEQTEILYYTFSATPDNEGTLDDMVMAFEEVHPEISVKVEHVSYDDYFTKLQTLIAGDNAPDVFELNYENFVSYAKKGSLLDMTSTIAEDESFDASVLNEQAYNAYNFEEKQFGMVGSFSNVVTFYNKDLFDQAGIDYPTNEWTWQDELAAAKEISKLGDDIYGTYSPVTMNEFYKVAAQNGGQLFDSDGTPTFDRAENIEALEYMVNNVVTEKVSPSLAEMAGQESGDLFVNGQLGMVHTGIWMFGNFAETDFEWDIVVEAGNTQKATHFFANGMVISNHLSEQVDKKAAAYEFVKFMSASPEVAEIRIANSWELPPTNDQEVLAPYLDLTPPTNRQVVFDSLDYLILPPAVDSWAKISDMTDVELEKVLLGEKTAEEALKHLQNEVLNIN